MPHPHQSAHVKGKDINQVNLRHSNQTEWIEIRDAGQVECHRNSCVAEVFTRRRRDPR